MKIVLRKYITGTYTETYEQTFDVPKKIASSEDVDDIVKYLDDKGLLHDNWGDEISFDDSIDDVDYEIKDS